MSKIDDLALKNAKKMQEDALKAYKKAKNNAKTNKNTQTTKQPIPQSTKTKKSIPVSNAKNKRTPSHGRHQVDADVREALNKEVQTNPIPQALTRFNEKIINNVALSPITTPYQIATGKKLIDFGLNPETKSAEVGAGVGNFLGTAVEYGMGYKAAGKAIEKGAEKLLTSAPGKKAAAKVVGSALGKKAGKEVAENVVKGVAKNIVGDATVGTVLNLADARGRGLEGKELAEDMAINAAFDFGVGNAVEFAPMAFKALKNAKLAKQAKNINLDTLSQNAKKVAETGDLGAQNGINTVKQTAGENLPFDSVKQEIPYRTVTPEAFEKITKAVESRSGCKVTFADLPDGVDGQYKNGVITISTKAKNPTYTVLKHELTHHIETSGHYKALSDFIENTMREAGYDVEGAINQIKADYAKKKVFLEDGDAKKEFIAKFTEEYLFNSEQSIERLARENPSLFRQVYDWIVDTIHKIGASAETKFLIDAQRKYEKALRTTGTVNINAKSQLSIPYKANNDLKSKQLEIVKNANPMTDNYHVGIRSAADIKTFEEAMKDGESFFYGDFDITDAEKALKSGEITVYSSKPIEQGGFVSTSQNMARDYAGGGKVYSKKVKLDDVAWINGDEGQYAKVNAAKEIPDINSRYNEAVKNGDKATLRQMVEDAANEAGYNNKLYHQTGATFTEFDTKNASAGKYDSELPTGIFMKPDSNDIGFKGKTQMELYSKIQNPLRFRDRANAVRFWEREIPGYKEANDRIKAIDNKYQAKYNDADRADDIKYAALHKKLTSGEITREEFKAQLEEVVKNTQKVLDDWKNASNEARLEAKRLIDDYIASSGYDGMIVDNDAGSFGRSVKTYISFDPKNVKSADPVTYNKNLEPIPLSKRFDSNNPDIRYSINSSKLGETDYTQKLRATSQNLSGTDNNGRTLTEGQQKYFKNSKVRDANGNLKVMYHGTGEAGFTVFESKYSDDGRSFFFTDNIDVAKGYSASDDIFSRKHFETIQSLEKHIAQEMDENVEIRKNGKMFELWQDNDFVVRDESLDDLYWDYNEYMGFGGDSANYKVYLNLENPLVIDADKNNWDEIPVPWSDDLMTTRSIAEYANENGYDGVMINNVIDTGLYGQRFDTSNIAIAFDSNQIKNVDNANPTNNPDIRFSQNISSLPETDYTRRLRAASENLYGEKGNKYMQTVDNTGNQTTTLKDLGADIARPQQTIAEAKKKYGAYGGKKGDIPLRTDLGRVTQGANTVYNSPIADEEMMKAIKTGVEEGSYWTRKMSNKEALNAAAEKIKESGLDNETTSFLNLARDNREVKGEDIAMGYQLAKEHIAQGNYEAAQAVLSDVCQMESEAGRALQAMRLFNSLSPEGRVKSVMRSAEKIKKNTGVEVKVSDEMLEQLKNATAEELPAIKKQINNELWDQVPATFSEKLTAWRYLAMLGNPRTHIRNIIGNALYVPVVRMDNVIQTGLEKAMKNRLNKLGTNKTTAILTNSADDKALKKIGAERFKQLKDTLDSGNGKYNEELRPLESRVFKSKLLEGAKNLNSNALEKEDQLFMELNFKSAFAQYCKANGKKAADLTDDFIEEAANHAYDVALRSTYRDPSRLADVLGRFRKRTLTAKATDTLSEKALKTAGRVVMDSALPFTKTPINILKRGVSHSPLGLVKGMAEIATAKDGKQLVKAITQVSEGLTGTGIVALGMYMASIGMANGSLGEYNKEYKWKQLLGQQDYALNVDDYSITLDWAAPISMPFFVGVELGTKLLEEKGNVWDAIESLSQIYEPVLEMSMLSGIQSLFDFSNGDSKDLVSFMGNAAQNLTSQYIPTILGQTARTAVDERKIALSTAENKMQRNTEKYIDKLENKIPGLTNTNESYVDMFGRTEKKESAADYIEAGLENFLSPAYVQKANKNKVETELERMRQVLGAEGKEILPTDYSYNYDIRYNGEDIRMTEEQFTKYKKVRGKATYEGLEELFNSSKYKLMSTNEKKKAIQDVYDKAAEDAKKSTVISMGIATETEYKYSLLSENAKATVDAMKKKGIPAKTAVNAYKTQKAYGSGTEKALALMKKGYNNQVIKGLDISNTQIEKARALQNAGISISKLTTAKKEADTNGNGNISKEEVINYVEARSFTPQEKYALLKALTPVKDKNNPYA